MSQLQQQIPEISTPEQKQNRKYRIKGNPLLQQAVITKYALGQNKRQIARDLGVHPDTITRTLQDSDMQRFIEYGRSRAVQLIPKSLDVAEYKLDRKDGTMALGILRGTRVLQSDQPTVQVANNFAFAFAALNNEGTLEQPASVPQIAANSEPEAIQRKPGRPRKSKSARDRMAEALGVDETKP